jgi:hypothetical protein
MAVSKRRIVTNRGVPYNVVEQGLRIRGLWSIDRRDGLKVYSVKFFDDDDGWR